MKKVNIIVLCVLVLLITSGCASTKITDRQKLVHGKLPRPANIWVYDFAATAADLPAYSHLARQYSDSFPYQTAADIATGRELGAIIANELVKEIRDMGLPAAHAAASTAPKINDIVLRGYLISYDEGDAKKRVTLGFGSGASNVRAAMEGYQMTAQGLRKLGSGETDAGSGGKSPGAAVGAAVFIATSNPVGLIVSSGVKLYGEKTGSSKVEGKARQTAEEISGVLKKRFQEAGWIR